MTRRHIMALVLCATALMLPARTWGSVFGEENGTLALILAEIEATTTGVRENLKVLRDNTALAADSAAFAREMVQVGKNGYTIATNPAEFMARMTRSWYQSFPELYSSLANVYDMRESIRQASNPADMPNYDPYAPVRAFDRLVDADASAFDVWAHAVDRWGINRPRDAAMQTLREQHDAAMQNVADTVNAFGLSPTQASITTARATSVSAAAQVRATATLESLNRTIELGIFSLAYGQEDARAERHMEEIRSLRVHADAWDLEPLRGRKTLKW